MWTHHLGPEYLKSKSLLRGAAERKKVSSAAVKRAKISGVFETRGVKNKVEWVWYATGRNLLTEKRAEAGGTTSSWGVLQVCNVGSWEGNSLRNVLFVSKLDKGK